MIPAISDSEANVAETIPVTIITGFLGAGKTTILNRILQDPAFKNSLVLINEYGEVGIDHLLIENLTDEVVLLKSGCVCCTLRGELAVTLLDLAAQRDAEVLPPFDHVILETTGLADPAPIMQILMTDPLLLESYRLGRVVTVVDCVNGIRTMESQRECLHQVAMADCLLISKSDLAGPAKKDALERKLANVNPGADHLVSVAGEIDPGLVLGSGEEENDLANLLTGGNRRDIHAGQSAHLGLVGEDETHDHDHEHDHEHEHHHNHEHEHAHCHDDDGQFDDCNHDHHHHDHQDGVGIQTFMVPFQRPPARKPLLAALEGLGSCYGEKLLRFKGLVQFEGEETPTLIQGVQDLMHAPVALKRWPEGESRSALVFIVDSLPSSKVTDALRKVYL
ncbi:GTP-binding protein [uncultured Cohaesibacter sp.]|uniref:CobW family GTP-binding protein n=1 Tax=uncultured Cohaesibacter sp. TaxID=1002546 RepID=UPI00292DD5DB|nr:GTP-binding protein [uncultured Cohaesibacter sp.]